MWNGKKELKNTCILFCFQEFDEPAVLLENPKSLFYGLVEQTGTDEAAILTEIAKQVNSYSENSREMIPS